MKAVLLLAILLFVTGCSTAATQSTTVARVGEESGAASGTYVIAEAAWAVPSLGVIADENLTIIDIVQGSAAEKAGLQRADVLIELQLVTAEATPVADATPIAETDTASSEEEPALSVADATATAESVTPVPEEPVAGEGLLLQATVEPHLLEPIPFVNEEAIGDLLAQTMVLKEVRKEPDGPMNYKPESGPFIIKIQRGDQVLALPITAENPPVVDVSAGDPTPTAIPSSYSYF